VSFNVVSFGAMVVTAALLLLAVEKSLNDIWAVRATRSIFKRFSNIWMIITLGPVLIFFSYYFGLSLYTSVISELAKTSWFYDAFLFVLPYIFSAVAFYILFQFVPYTAVRADAAILGAAFSGIVWEFSKVPFTAYVSNVIDPSAVYGSLGVIPFFLLWLYLSWVITLFGAELAYCKQNYDLMASAHKYDEHFLPLYRGYHALILINEVANSFDAGEGPLKVSRAARRLRLPLNLCWELAENLRKNQILSYAGRDRSHFQLAKPPDRITLMDVLSGVSATSLHVPPAADSPLDRRIREVFEVVNNFREETLDGVTFADVVRADGI
jgi:membrane protein